MAKTQERYLIWFFVASPIFLPAERFDHGFRDAGRGFVKGLNEKAKQILLGGKIR
ncbi:MAG: hypothetical protein ACE5IB_05005 [Candidatus Geothermarchaeales archaeon]